MAHYRKPVAVAVAVNAAIFLVERAAGYQASSLSLIMDSIHNMSDELALVCLYLAFIVARAPSQKLLQSSSVVNSVGLGGVALWFIVSTARVVIALHEELIWPETIICGHPDYGQPQAIVS